MKGKGLYIRVTDKGTLRPQKVEIRESGEKTERPLQRDYRLEDSEAINRRII
ncbi:MAG: hypothetical protein ABR519_03080 [Bacteroidales bacterium]